MERDQAIKFMLDLLKLMVQKKGSDLFITVGFPPAMKIDGKMTPVSKQALTPDNAKSLVYCIMNDRQLKEFDASKECNFAIAPPRDRSFPLQRLRAAGFPRAGGKNHHH